MYIDPMYWLFALPGLLLSLVASLYVKYIFSRYSHEDSGKDLTGLEAAEKIVKGEGFPVSISLINGKLNDHFDPVRDVVGISKDNEVSKSVSHIAVVAHELGHVQQKFSKSTIYKIRRVLVPITEIGTQVGYVLFVIGILISALRLSELGLIFFSSSVLFSLVTLPLEFDASKRGIALIKEYGLMDSYSIGNAKKVLNAAALTYVAGLLTSILNLLYFLSLLNRRR